MVLIEKSFPRGGTIKPQIKDQSEKIVFGARQKKKQKSNITNKEKIENDFELHGDIEAISAELLNYKTIQEGMILLCYIKEITSTYLKVALPGHMIGKIPILSISNSYTKLLNKIIDNHETIINNDYKTLNELYHIGEKMYAKVMKIQNTENGKINIELSIKPIDLHSNMNYKNIKKGMIFNCAIEEIQEHGYVIEIGITNLRCFLPFDKATTKQYNIGQLICIKIEKLTIDKIASTAICKEIKESNKRKIKDLIEPKLEYLLPTLIVNFTITKILKDGLQGTIMNGNFTAYCNEHHLSEILSIPSDYELNSIHFAQILYIMPLTKLVYLSLNFNTNDDDDDDNNEILYKKGDIIENAVVNRIGTGGIILTIDNKYKGLISFKSIKTNLIANYDQDELLAKYYKNSKHKIRVITYDPIESLYVCTDNLADINEKYYSLNDIEVGEFVTGIVEQKHKSNGYYLKIGKVRGYIEKLYLSSATMNLSENSKLRCRVIAKNSDRNIVYLTNRSEYMSKNIKILKKYSQVKENCIFLGTIVKCDEKFLIINFFNNIKGVLYEKYLNGKQIKSSFYEGQTMNFRIITYKNNKLLLGLLEDTYKKGEICSGKIAHILDDGLDVILSKNSNNNNDNSDENDYNNQLRGIIPIRLLSEFSNLITLRIKDFQINEKLNEIVCIEKNIFSLRDVQYFKENPIKLWKNIKIGDIIRGFIKNVNNDIIEISLPIIGFNQLIKIHINMLLTNTIESNQINTIQLYPEQIVYVKILSKNKIDKIKTLTISAKLLDVWNGNLHDTSNLFIKYLNELNLIRKSLKRQNNLLGSLKIGQIYNTKVINFDDNHNCYVQLLLNNDNTNTIQGIIKNSILSKTHNKLSIGNYEKCIILWIDYLNEIVYLSNNIHDLKHITEGYTLSENLINKIGLNAKILLITNDVIICSLKKGNINPFILIPTKLHYNDFENSIMHGIIEGDFCRLAIIHDKYSIGIFENLWKLWHKVDQKYENNRKRKISENDNEIIKATDSKKSKIIKKGEKNDEIKNESSYSENDESDDEAIGSKSLLKINQPMKKQNENKKKQNKNTKKSILEVHENNVEESDKKGKEKITGKLKDLQLKKCKNEETLKGKKKKENEEKPIKDIVSTVKSEIENEILEEPQSKKSRKEEKSTKTTLKLPGPSNFWSNDIQLFNSNVQLNNDSSSDDDDDDDNTSKMNLDKKKKKKLTSAEKFQAAKEEEARLREIEEKYANPNIQPETIDQFERLILSKPNDSKIWINYMVFHLQATEIDKARLIGRKALKTISFREENELINIWIALLNLELRYGTKETFNDIFKESLLYNDPYKIYTRVLCILSDAKKIPELIDLILICTKKFKDKPEIWKNSAIAYFEVNLHEKAKQLLHKALTVLPERDHINTIVTFANLNHKYGDKETAHALFEQIITSYPKRVDVWSQYIDMLIKDQEIESARQTLNRAVAQKIPLKKMRTLFKKYLDFEEKYGTEENVLKVKEMAAHYVKKEIGV